VLTVKPIKLHGSVLSMSILPDAMMMMKNPPLDKKKLFHIKKRLIMLKLKNNKLTKLEENSKKI
jgi:hypothetical protein